MPKVSVLMPVYNGGRFLREAIESVLTQTYQDLELLVLDDGSTDDTVDIVASYPDRRIHLISNEHRGLVFVLNQGLAFARGELVARQDADDRSHPDRLAMQAASFDEDEDLVLLGTQARVIESEGRVVGVLDRPQDAVSIRWHLLFDNSFIHSSVMFRRDLVRQCDGYEALRHCEDYALWVRLATHGSVANHPERLVDYRVNPHSIYGTMAPETLAVSRAGNRVIIARHLQALFGVQAWTHEAVEHLAQFRWGIPAASRAEFLTFLSQLLERYYVRDPQAARSSDFRRMLARQYDELAMKLIPGSRWQAIQVYAQGIRHDPAMALALSWPRALALATLGPQGRRWLGTPSVGRLLRWPRVLPLRDPTPSSPRRTIGVVGSGRGGDPRSASPVAEAAPPAPQRE